MPKACCIVEESGNRNSRLPGGGFGSPEFPFGDSGPTVAGATRCDLAVLRFCGLAVWQHSPGIEIPGYLGVALVADGTEFPFGDSGPTVAGATRCDLAVLRFCGFWQHSPGIEIPGYLGVALVAPNFLSGIPDQQLLVPFDRPGYLRVALVPPNFSGISGPSSCWCGFAVWQQSPGIEIPGYLGVALVAPNFHSGAGWGPPGLGWCSGGGPPGLGGCTSRG